MRRPATENLPPYRWVDEQTALNDLALRAAAVKTVSAECDLTLTREDGESVRLDGALAMEPPNSLRLRAWKFNQAVFDLTWHEQALWVVTPSDSRGKEKALPAALSAARFGREWSWFSGGFFSSPQDLSALVRGEKLVVRRPLDDGRAIVCEVDRASLTPRRYLMLDASGAARFALSLRGYREIGGVPFPTRYSASGDGGRILVALREVELNQALPPNAFVPPRRAVRQP